MADLDPVTTSTSPSSPLSSPNEDIWDGHQFSPEFSVVLKQFIANNSAVKTKYVMGETTYDLTSASGNKTIAHGLGKKPSYVRLWMQYVNGKTFIWSMGSYNGTTQRAVGGYQDGTNGGSGSLADLGFTNDVSGNAQFGTATIDATNITIAFIKSGSPSGTAYLFWEAWG